MNFYRIKHLESGLYETGGCNNKSVPTIGMFYKALGPVKAHLKHRVEYMDYPGRSFEYGKRTKPTEKQVEDFLKSFEVQEIDAEEFNKIPYKVVTL